MKPAREGRRRKLHRREWPAFLTRMVPAGVWQALARVAEGDDDPRIRWTLKYVLLAYLIMGWSHATGLGDRFGEAYACVVALFPRRRRPGRTYVGLAQAGKRHGWTVFRQFWACLRPSLPARVGEAWTWFGWTVFAVDGSRVEAPRTRANERKLGRAGRKKTGPQWWMTWLVHLPTLLLWDWQQGPGTSSERRHMRAMLGALPEGALLVADAGFGGFKFLKALAKGGVHFLVRCGGNTRLLVEGTVHTIKKEGDHRYVYLWPIGKRRQRPLRLRLIVLKRGRRCIYLLTNVLETTRLSRSMASTFYTARWGIEVNYRAFKCTLERTKVQATTPGPGGLELAGNILAMGLLRLHAAMVLGAQTARMSAAGILRVIRRAMEGLRFGRSTAWLLAALENAVKDAYHRRRSKRARDWPHKKHESPPQAPDLRRLSCQEKAQIHASFQAATA